MDTLKFSLESDEVKILTENDSHLLKLVRHIGTIELILETNYFNSLVKQIVGQQLSLKAAQTIFTRVEGVWGNLDPNKLSGIEDDVLRGAGLSRSKITYLRDLTEKHLSGEINFSTIHLLDDEEVIQTLTKIKGVGKWTAEMILIFSLGRLNTLSPQDVSIKNAIKWLYNEEEVDFSYYFEKWNPFNSVASLYLWEAVNRGLLKAPFIEL
ncbi:DNA-3-methyladenine glycosylase family protein [Bacillus suaedaesalsae]|uniref:DNA-3-methyladenine glycosylase II n=1 Tax=Bacillus suaedaesalsae TaxID=2810349 RepID=A0ABS2DHU8_9BACI|nr:DNA-3-methyladenine glycosylase 2 family protein [Bacillus suaedaesalsae]MBM6618014.1 DNA-3-methyladenine glycosylase 2 family protein [Bacillus suaedaesalsae]